jgi:hypothetical protein
MATFSFQHPEIIGPEQTAISQVSADDERDGGNRRFHCSGHDGHRHQRHRLPTGMCATNSDEAPQVVGTPQASEDLLLAEKDDPGW